MLEHVRELFRVYIYQLRAGEMIQAVLAALPEDPGSVPSSHTRRFTTACSSGSRDSLLRLPGRYTQVQTPTHRHTHK